MIFSLKDIGKTLNVKFELRIMNQEPEIRNLEPVTWNL